MEKYMAHILVVENLALVVSYSAIIIVVWRQKSIRKESTQAKRKRPFINTLTLYMCITLVFVAATTPYVVAHIVDWRRPFWLRTLSIYLFSMSQIMNSLLFIIQKSRISGKRTITKNNQILQPAVESNTQDTRL